ncbi:FG-GAP repeat domain-containing protein [Tepidamorphus sp. 3E244]|uniref:FG-GAP repeat domain-containing protein n=1 Tax=Tepidamorphus sp. 3E244 TaxID=3385498 RepID=UPI0038FD02FF
MAFAALALPAWAEHIGLPDGGKATSVSGDIAEAWYTAPTRRYGHGVLGDAIEAGALAVRLRDGTVMEMELDARHVFEDLTPRIADLDGDGRNEVITIRSSLSGGAAVAVYGLRGETFRQVAASDDIGLRNRWLNIAAIHDFDGDGQLEIAAVRTPHIGGALQVWELGEEGLRKQGELGGFSNHVIGSRALALSAMIDVTGDGKAELVIPDQSRENLMAVTVSADSVTVVAHAELADRAVGDFSVSGARLTVPLASGEVASLSAADFRQ